MTASAFNVITVNSNYPSLPVVAVSNPPVSVLLYNADPANTIFLADNNAADSGNVNISTPLPPLSSVSFDGTETVYASTLPGLTALLQVYPTGASYFGVIGVTPITQMGSVGGAAAVQVTPTSPGVIVSLAPVGQFVSYDLNMFAFAQLPGQVGSPITAQVQLQWFDDATSGIPVFEEDWYIWLGRAAPTAGTNSLAACGPMHGKYMAVNVYIPPGATSDVLVQYVNLFGSNRPQPYSDWRQNGEAVNPQINAWQTQSGGGLSFENLLVSDVNYPVGASSNVFWPLGLYAGPVWMTFAQSAACTLTPVVAALAGLVGGQIPATNDGQPNTIYRTPNSGLIQAQFILPRSACALFLGSGAGGVSVSMTITAQQAA